MRTQTKHVVIWIAGLLIAIPLFIALAGLNFAMTLAERICAARKPVNLV